MERGKGTTERGKAAAALALLDDGRA